MKVAVIGGGASGLMSAIFSAKNGNDVDLFEANEKVGKKIYITGKGRCNVTNASDTNDIMQQVVNNSKFLYSSLYSFSSEDTINFFENAGVPIKIERGNRAFPASDKSSDIISALLNKCNNLGVKIHLNSKVVEIKKNDDKFDITTIHGIYSMYDATIICTGGCTYSATGSTGDGYRFAKSFGHSVTKISPALVPVLLNDGYVKELEGLSLKNVKLMSFVDGKKFKEFFGEMLFTSNGISGPIALSMSSYINRQTNVSLKLDLKPALDNNKLQARIVRDIDNLREKQISTLLCGLLPKSLASVFILKLGFDEKRKCKTLNTKEIDKIVNLLKNFDLNYRSLDKLDYGIITSGGVNVSEVNPRTLESKLISGLYFAGEVLDVDALTGGYNLQIAFATGHLAGLNAGNTKA